MINASFYVNYKIFLKNNIFTIKNFFVSLQAPKLLKETFKEHGVYLSTQDINKPESSSFTIFNDIPNELKKIPKNSYLIIWESEIVIKKNWVMNNHIPYMENGDEELKHCHPYKFNLDENYKRG